MSTILDLNEKLGAGKIRPEVIQQFERLKRSLPHVTDDAIDEKDIFRIEEATNQVLEQVRALLADEERPVLFNGERH